MKNTDSINKIMLGTITCIVIVICVLSVILLTKVGNLQDEISEVNKKVKEIHNEVVYLPEEIEIDEENFGEGEWYDEEFEDEEDLNEEYYEEVEAE